MHFLSVTQTVIFPPKRPAMGAFSFDQDGNIHIRPISAMAMPRTGVPIFAKKINGIRPQG